MVTVDKVLKGSPSYKAGIRAKDIIISLNGRPLEDELDLIFADSEEKVKIELTDRNIEIAKKAYEPLGLIFNKSLEIHPERCKNKCIFCFIDQLPEGMRDTLYIKDDDYRLSFITGSYITLTNLRDSDIERIIRYKLSPLYISVHAYDDEIRKKMTGNPNSLQMFNIIRKLGDGGIQMHAQIVLVKGVNDKEVLNETLRELLNLYPVIKTVAVVPVGLTRHREKLYPIVPLSSEDAEDAIKITEKINEKASEKARRGFAWCSDEMYLRAGRKLPPYDYYGDFMQIENGVGMVRAFEDSLTFNVKGEGEYHLVTGVSFYPILREIAERLSEASGASLIVHKIDNNYFGHTVTVAGLITAADIIGQLKGKVDGKKVLIPSEMLKEFEDVFLDGMSAGKLSEELNAEIIIVRDNLEEIISGDTNG